MRRLVIFLFLLCTTASAAVDPSLFQDLHWRSIGPFRGGRVLAVSGIPSEPEHFYFGSVNGGVWETRDAGRTWQPIFDSQPIGSIGALAIAESNPNVIYAGTGEADMRSDIAQGDGMYKSADGGKTWAHIGLADSQQIGRVLIHPENPDVVYVAALGHPYGPNAERGVFRSRDGGTTWQRILSRNNDSDTGAIDLAFEPGNPSVIYAALWQTRRTPWSVYPSSSGPGSGLFKTTDGGDHWTEIAGHGLPEKPGRIGIAVAPGRPQRVYAIVDAPLGGMYRSDDGGANWTKTSGDTRIWSRGWYFGGVTVEPKNADVVYSANVNLYRSDDAGKTFAPVKGAPGGDDYHTLWIDPHHPDRRILGVDQGSGDLAQQRPHVELLVQPAHRPVLPRDHRQEFSVSRLRCAAGFRRGRCAEPHEHVSGDQSHALPRNDGGRRERQRRARPEGSGDHLRRARREARHAHAADADDRSDPRPSGQLPAHVVVASRRSRIAIRAFSTSRTSASSAPTTAASTGMSSVPTSRARIRGFRRTSIRQPRR